LGQWVLRYIHDFSTYSTTQLHMARLCFWVIRKSLSLIKVISNCDYFIFFKEVIERWHDFISVVKLLKLLQPSTASSLCCAMTQLVQPQKFLKTYTILVISETNYPILLKKPPFCTLEAQFWNQISLLRILYFHIHEI